MKRNKDPKLGLTTQDNSERIAERMALDPKEADAMALAGFTLPHEIAELVTREQRQDAYLAAIEEHGCAHATAALMAGVSRWSAWRWREEPGFAARLIAARRIGVEKLIAECERRAMNGSDRLLEFLLTNYAPDRFSSNRTKLDVTSSGALAERLARGRLRNANATAEALAVAGVVTTQEDEDANALGG